LHALPVAVLAIPAVAIGRPEQHVRNASHCGSKQQKITHRDRSIIDCLRQIYMGVVLRALLHS